MRIGALALVVLTIVISLAYLQGKSVDSHSSKQPNSLNSAQAPPLNGGPLFWFPSKSEFIARENDPFLVLVGVNCGNSKDAPRFELLPPTPSFVTLSTICQPDTDSFARALLRIAPQAGDVGKYQIRIGVTSCGASPDEVAHEVLSLKVKRPL